MTRFWDWTNIKDMDSRQKSGINTSATFAEQRENEEKAVPKEFGIKEMSEEVNIEWDEELTEKSKAHMLYTTPGALSEKKSGGKEGVHLMKELDKRIKKQPSDLDPKPEKDKDENKHQ